MMMTTPFPRNALIRPTAAERVAGRFMRAPDGHDAGAAAPAADAAPAGGEGAAAAPAADAADQVTSLAGGAAPGAKDAAPAADGDKGADPAADADKKGDGEGDKGDAPIETLGAPEAYAVSAPEGMEFDKEAFDKVEPILRELNLSNDAAQKLVGTYAGEVIPLLMERGAKRAEDAQTAANVKFRADLAAEAKADPEIGGAQFDQTISLVADTWERFGIKPGQGVRQLLDDSGLGNHVEILKFLSRVGKATGEGSFAAGEGAGGGGGRKSDTDVFYGAAT